PLISPTNRPIKNPAETDNHADNSYNAGLFIVNSLYTAEGVMDTMRPCSPAKKGKVSPPCPFSLKPKRLLRVMQASSLTDSLRSVVRLRRAVSAHSKAVIRLSTESGDNAGKNM
ncbi:hypothetical protein, partial [Escherichia coli]|uniref:hypothetical protein n=1 Tax=Escherichia coli TaxID=562 RepID=UPI001C9A8BED